MSRQQRTTTGYDTTTFDPDLLKLFEGQTRLTKDESTYLTAISPVDNNPSLTTMFDKMNKLTIERITFDLRIATDEYKQNLIKGSYLFYSFYKFWMNFLRIQ